MKKSDERAPEVKVVDLDLPDWSGMDDSAARVTPEMAFAYCENYPRWFPGVISNGPGPTDAPM